MVAPSSYGALSATSANTIQGSRPGFTGQSGAKKLGFKIGNTTYSESEGNLSPSSSGVINYLNAGLSLNEFKVMNLTASDFNPANDYADADGDLAHPTAAFSMSPRTFEWKDRTGATISTSDYNKTLGCGSNLKLPLTLRITLPNVKVKSRYGNPSESIPTELVKEYKIGTESGICFAQPNAMKVDPSYNWIGVTNSVGTSWSWNGGSITPHQNNGGGYDPAQFDPTWGFKASLSTKFPTTGFPKASFYLIMTSNSTDYTFTHNGGSAVTIGTDGKVTLNSKPSGPVTITAKFNGTSQAHTYTFDPRTVWVVPKPANRTYAQAKTTCGGESKIPTLAQLTNSPRKTAPQNWSWIENYYTRKVDGSVFGEWGWTSSTNYPGSQWYSGSYDYYWTRGPWSTGSQFCATSYDGTVHYTYTSYSNYVACLE
ncbi:hypothetical protein RCS94_00130 [Orbaceae bacterium ac157xtp]